MTPPPSEPIESIEPKPLGLPQATMIPGLDEMLGGGVTPNRTYLVEGTAGTGKTTLGLQWLMAGIKVGEAGIYVSLAETRDELEEIAQSHGWTLEPITLCEAVVPEEVLSPEGQPTVFSAADVELSETTRKMMELTEKLKPKRLVIDSLSEMRVLAQNPYRHRQQVVALKRFFQNRNCTVLMLDDRSSARQDLHLPTAAHGVIHLEQMPPEYGDERRRLRVLKMRGKSYSLGFHDFVIRRGGLEVFPRLVASEHGGSFEKGQLKSGIAELDTLLGGGPGRGTSTLVMGPAGTGKSSLTQQFAVAAANRGERAVIFTFEESIAAILARSDNIGLGLRAHVESGRIVVKRIDPGQICPGEFVALVRAAVESTEGGRLSVVVFDSLNSYMNVLPEERFLMIQLHELLYYLSAHGVVSFLIAGQRGLVGPGIEVPVQTTYLADNVILLRFFEAAGEIKLVVAAVKMRSGHHERTLRELSLGQQGIRIGAALHDFQGVLTGHPTFLGKPDSLLGGKK